MNQSINPSFDRSNRSVDRLIDRSIDISSRQYRSRQNTVKSRCRRHYIGEFYDATAESSAESTTTTTGPSSSPATTTTTTAVTTTGTLRYVTRKEYQQQTLNTLNEVSEMFK